MSATASTLPASQTIEERAIQLFRANFAVLNKPDLSLASAIRYLINRPFHFVTTPGTPFALSSGRIFGGTIITPHIEWNRVDSRVEGVGELNFFLSVDAAPVVRLRPRDPAKGIWTALCHPDAEKAGHGGNALGVLYIE